MAPIPRKRSLALLLVLVALASTGVLARDSTKRRTTLRGVHQFRELGTGNKHTKSNGSGKAKSGGGGGRSPKSSKPDSEDLPDAKEDEKDDGKGHDDNKPSGNNKSPKGMPGSDLGGDSEDMSDGKNTKANSGKNTKANSKGGKGKGKEHFHHGESL